MTDDKYKDCLQHVGVTAKMYAREAIKEHVDANNESDEDYSAGYMMGLHRMITLMQQQADVFEIPLKELDLSDIDGTDFFK